MTLDADPRLILARDGRADRRLEGVIAANRFVTPEATHVVVGATALRAAPDPRAEQKDLLLFGEGLRVLDRDGGWAFGQAQRDGYVGWVEAAALGQGAPAPTHRVSELGAVALAAPAIRAAAVIHLSLNALVRVVEDRGRFVLAQGAGWVPASALASIGLFEADPAAVAERFVGVPYLWGGRDRAGIDCSGLVQQALFACGRACPRDSDLQAALGLEIGPGDLRRNDLVCWRGHIGLMMGADRLVHASGRQMAVVIEPLAEAVAARLEETGPPTGFRRLFGP